MLSIVARLVGLSVAEGTQKTREEKPERHKDSGY